MTTDVAGAALVLCVGGPAGGCAARAVRLPRRGGASDDAVGRAVARAAGRSGGGRGVAMCHAAGKVGWGGGQTEVRRRCVTLKVWWGKEEGVGRRGGRGAALCRASGMVGMGEVVGGGGGVRGSEGISGTLYWDAADCATYNAATAADATVVAVPLLLQ